MSSAAPTATSGPVQSAITQKLLERFQPQHIDVINESHMHSVPKGSETHFKVVVVSDVFDGVKVLDRHRMVNDCLAAEMGNPVHALSIVAKAPAQWTGAKVEPSPSCRGGFGK